MNTLVGVALAYHLMRKIYNNRQNKQFSYLVFLLVIFFYFTRCFLLKNPFSCKTVEKSIF